MNSTIVFIAKNFIFLSLLIFGLYWLTLSKRKKINVAFEALLGGLIALLLAKIAASLYYDTRPFVSEHIKPLFAHANDNGFPSDHTLLASFLAFVIWRESRAVASILVLLALLIGSARVAAHVHSPIDIAGSFVIAAVAVLITQGLIRIVQRRRSTSDWRQRPIH